MLDLDQLLQHAVEQRASDIHLKVGSRPYLRVDGALRQTPFEVVEPEETERLAPGIMPRRRAEQFRQAAEPVFCRSVAGRTVASKIRNQRTLERRQLNVRFFTPAAAAELRTSMMRS